MTPLRGYLLKLFSLQLFHFFGVYKLDWHSRYTQQAAWTRDLRAYIFDQAGLASASRLLEVGCGTGAILSELVTSTALYGVDLDPAALADCRIHAPAASLIQGDTLSLPYLNEAFDIVYCHFLLLWVHNPIQALREMKRVTRVGGYVIAFAEPDYSDRIDKPEELIQLGRWQTESLKRQGADPGFGSRLAESFFRAGIQIRETGTIQGVRQEPTPGEWENEWTVIESDLAGMVPEEEIQKLKLIDERARKRGDRILHVPTYFAWGQV
jgi:SAM-dependent methyltransferase